MTSLQGRTKQDGSGDAELVWSPDGGTSPSLSSRSVVPPEVPERASARPREHDASASASHATRFTRGILGSLGNGNRRRYSGRDDWRTPRALFLQLDAEFGFTLDAAAASHNAQCGAFFTERDDALSQSWTGVVWCNPPYRSELIGKFVRKGYESSVAGATVVMLVPVRADLEWWHEYALRAAEIRFIRGRVRFEGMRGTAPFASCVLVFRASAGRV